MDYKTKDKVLRLITYFGNILFSSDHLIDDMTLVVQWCCFNVFLSASVKIKHSKTPFYSYF